jgi:hypothetical protein
MKTELSKTRSIFNYEDGMAAVITEVENGIYNVSVKDLCSGEFLPTVYRGYTEYARAEYKAHEVIGLSYPLEGGH